MSNNRHTIDDSAILGAPHVLDKGLPIPGLGKSYIVDEGWVAVITQGGAYQGTLRPGTHALNKYRFGVDLRAIPVDTRNQTLTVSTTREFTIAHPVAVAINLDLAVEYCVVDPRRIALEIRNPLTNLYDRVIQAARGAISNATVDEIRRQGEGIATTMLQRLKAAQLPKVLGIEVLNVLVTTIKATDTDQDALASQDFKEYTAVRDWQLDSQMVANSQVTWEWLLIHRPEVAQQMFATYGDLAKELIERGAVDPSGFLNQPLNNAGQFNINQLMSGFGFPSNSPTNMQQPSIIPQNPLIPNQSSQPQLSVGAQNIHARMKEETGYLKTIPGAQVEMQAGVDDDGIPDDSYLVRIIMPRNSGGQIVLYIACSSAFPSSAPSLSVEADGQDIPFDSNVIRRWSGQYLIEIAREVQQRVG